MQMMYLSVCFLALKLRPFVGLFSGKNAVSLMLSEVADFYCVCSLKELHGLLSVCERAPRSECHFAPGFSWTWRCIRRCTHVRSYNLPSRSWRPRSRCRWTRWRPETEQRVTWRVKPFLAVEIYYIVRKRENFLLRMSATEQHTCLMSQLTFHCLMVLYLQVFTTSSMLRSMRIRRLLAIPSNSSLRHPLNLQKKKKRRKTEMVQDCQTDSILLF